MAQHTTASKIKQEIRQQVLKIEGQEKQILEISYEKAISEAKENDSKINCAINEAFSDYSRTTDNKKSSKQNSSINLDDLNEKADYQIKYARSNMNWMEKCLFYIKILWDKESAVKNYEKKLQKDAEIAQEAINTYIANNSIEFETKALKKKYIEQVCSDPKKMEAIYQENEYHYINEELKLAAKLCIDNLNKYYNNNVNESTNQKYSVLNPKKLYNNKSQGTGYIKADHLSNGEFVVVYKNISDLPDMYRTKSIHYNGDDQPDIIYCSNGLSATESEKFYDDLSDPEYDLLKDILTNPTKIPKMGISDQVLKFYGLSKKGFSIFTDNQDGYKPETHTFQNTPLKNFCEKTQRAKETLELVSQETLELVSQETLELVSQEYTITYHNETDSNYESWNMTKEFTLTDKISD